MTQAVTTNTTKSATAVDNPFIGLKPFSKEEKATFFGRTKEVREVLRKLKSTRFLAIVGASGSGKTSMIKAGIIPELEDGFEGQGGTKWGIATFTPGRNPIGNMATALAQRNVLSPDIKAEPNSNKIEETLRRSSLGLVNCVKERSESLAGKNLILVINQFEELFSLMNHESKRNEARDFVKLLLRGINEKERPIYVLISIESDMLSEITKFRGLPEIVNQGQYLMPRMTKQDLREVILKPLRSINLPMNERLRGVLLEDIEYTDDQLPVLQHALMQTVNKWETAKAIAVANQEELDVIEREHYNNIGDYSEALIEDFENKWETYKKDFPATTSSNIYELEENLLKQHRSRDDKEMHVARLINAYQFKQEREYYEPLKPIQKALGVHGEEVFASLEMAQRPICERVFKAITNGAKGIENVKTQPVEVATLANIAQVSTDEVKEVLEVFLKDGVNFIQSNQKDLRGSTTITLTHGSLVRKWNRLKNWVEEETESSKTYVRLASDAAIHEATPEKQGLWRDNQLSFGEAWYKNMKPNENWAMRYHPGYGTAIRFLEASIAKRNAELEKARLAEEEDKRRRRMILWIVSIAAAICLALAGWAIIQSRAAAKSADEAKVKEQLANLSALEAEAEKKNARSSAREAAAQAKIATEKEAEAKQASKTAAVKAEEARIAANKAKKAAAEAKIAEEEAVRQGQIAEKEKAIAKEKAEEAAIAEAAAVKAEGLAQKLKLQSLAEAIAIKSKRIDNKPQVQGQIAKKAVEIFQKSDNLSENEIFNPAIYEGAYFGIKKIKESQGNKAFNGFVAGDKHRGTIHTIARGNNAFYTAGSDGKILKWDVATNGKVDRPKVVPSAIGKRSETVMSMAVNSRNLVVGGKDRRVAIYTLGSPDAPTEVDVHNGRFVWKVGFVDGGKIVSSGQDRKVCVTDITAAKNGQKSKVIFTTTSDVKQLDVHTNKQNVVLGDVKGRLSVININTPNKEKHSAIIKGGKEISAIKYSQNGRYIAVGDVSGKLYIYSSSLDLLKEYEAHGLDITSIEFKGSSNLVTTSRDRTAKYWHLDKLLKEGNYAPFVFNDHTDWCTAASFTGSQAVIGCKDGSIKFWALDLQTLSNELCGLLKSKPIVKKDWDKYIGDDDELEELVGTSTCQ